MLIARETGYGAWYTVVSFQRLQHSSVGLRTVRRIWFKGRWRVLGSSF